LTRNAAKSVVYKLFVSQHITSYSVPIVSQLRAPFVVCPVNYLTNDTVLLHTFIYDGFFNCTMYILSSWRCLPII